MKRSSFVVVAISALAACADSPSSPLSADVLESRGSSTSSATTTGALVRVTCEVRSGRRSKISVDANNLPALGAMYSASVTSGANSASAPAAAAVGDEAEFDFDSDPANIRAGATAIAAGFIAMNAAGPDVMATVKDAAGNVVATGAGECRVR